MKQLQIADNYGDHEFGWQKKYGPFYRVKGCFGEDRLVAADPQALSHILNNPSFMHPPTFTKMIHLLFGAESVLGAEGEEHRRLRAAMSPGFSGQSGRAFLPVFVDVAKKMVQECENMCSEAGIGLPINTVQNPDHPLVRLNLLGSIVTLTVHLHSFARNQRIFHHPYPAFVLRRAFHIPIGPLAVIHKFQTLPKQFMDEKAQDFEKDEDKFDLLNMILFGSGPEKAGVTQNQLLQQIPGFLVGGQDTSVGVLIPNSNRICGKRYSPTREAYENMPLLNALLKTSMRRFTNMYPQDVPGHPITRAVRRRGLCPLPLPSEIVMSTGKRIRELPVRKGQFIFIAVAAYQRYPHPFILMSPELTFTRLESLWGPDAHEFKPSRWLEGEPCTGQALGPYAHLMAFPGGYRVFAGWHFAVLEMQVILSELVAKFSVSLPEDSIVRARVADSQFPVDGEGQKGLWLSVERVNY
ncbi:cytochrome P450 [Mycena vulgaris]|nr:cytochrome P450 [Mycena vulgaris]